MNSRKSSRISSSSDSSAVTADFPTLSIKSDSTNSASRRIVSKDQVGVAGAWILWTNSSDLKFQAYDGGWVTATYSAYSEDSNWHHVIANVSGGRVGAFEVLVSTPGIVNNLRKVDGLLQLRQLIATGVKQGMQTMEMHLAQLVRRGIVSEMEAEFKARDTEEFRRHLHAGTDL